MIPVHERHAYYARAAEAHKEGLITAPQLRAFRYWSHGLGYKRIGTVLGISRDAARGRIDRTLSVLQRRAAA